MSFNGKVVIVTGAGSGIGASTALKFDEEGAKVVLVDKDEKKLFKIMQKCKDSHGILADISVDDDIKRIITETIDKLNKIDVLVNCAGIAKLATILQDDLISSYTETLNINLRAPIYLIKLAAPYLIQTKGNIVNISSNIPQIRTCPPYLSMYSVSKAGLNTFTVLAALELSSHGVRVNAISPGPIDTAFRENCNLPFTTEQLQAATALNRISRPEEIADLVLFLASDKAEGITGSNILSDNGYTLKTY